MNSMGINSMFSLVDTRDIYGLCPDIHFVYSSLVFFCEFLFFSVSIRNIPRGSCNVSYHAFIGSKKNKNKVYFKVLKPSLDICALTLAVLSFESPQRD